MLIKLDIDQTLAKKINYDRACKMWTVHMISVRNSVPYLVLQVMVIRDPLDRLGSFVKNLTVSVLLHCTKSPRFSISFMTLYSMSTCRMVDDQQRKIDMKFRAAEEKQRIAEVQYKHAEDSLRQCAAVFQASKDLAQDFISSLALLTKDLRHDEIKPIDAITGFVRHLETKLGETSERMALKEQRDVMDGLRCVTENLLHAAEDRKLRTAAPLALHISAISSLKSNETIGSYEMQDASNLKDQLIRYEDSVADMSRQKSRSFNASCHQLVNQEGANLIFFVRLFGRKVTRESTKTSLQSLKNMFLLRVTRLKETANSTWNGAALNLPTKPYLVYFHESGVLLDQRTKKVESLRLADVRRFTANDSPRTIISVGRSTLSDFVLLVR